MQTQQICRVLCRLAAKLKNIYCFNLSDFVWFCDFLLSDVVFRLRDKIICYTFGMFSAIDKLCGACATMVAGENVEMEVARHGAWLGHMGAHTFSALVTQWIMIGQ